MTVVPAPANKIPRPPARQILVARRRYNGRNGVTLLIATSVQDLPNRTSQVILSEVTRNKEAAPTTGGPRAGTAVAVPCHLGHAVQTPTIATCSRFFGSLLWLFIID